MVNSISAVARDTAGGVEEVRLENMGDGIVVLCQTPEGSNASERVVLKADFAALVSLLGGQHVHKAAEAA